MRARVFSRESREAQGPQKTTNKTVVRFEDTFDKLFYGEDRLGCGPGFVFEAVNTKKDDAIIKIWEDRVDGEPAKLHWQTVLINPGPKSKTKSFNNAPAKTEIRSEGEVEMTGIRSVVPKDPFDPTLVIVKTTTKELKFRAQTEEEAELVIEGFDDLAQAATRVLKAKSAATNPLRRLCWNITQNNYFDGFILLCIAVNCVVMARDNDDEEIIGEILGFIFMGEAALKLVALLPYTKEKDGYFQDNWNNLDFFIVLAALLQYIPGFANFTVLRILRVLRPLRSIGKLQGMKMLINTLLEEMGDLFMVVVLTFFVFLVFSVVGMELFKGFGSNRCIADADGDWTVLPDSMTNPIEERRCGGDYSCPTGYTCMVAGLKDGQIESLNQADGIRGFDNIGQALLSVFVCATLEGWVDIMYMHQDTYNWVIAMIYHVLLVLLGAFLCLNLALAIIAAAFEDQAEEAKAGHEAEAEAAAEAAGADGEEVEKPECSLNPFSEGFLAFTDEPPVREKACIGIVFDMVTSSWFSILGNLAIMLNTLSLAVTHVNVECISPAPGVPCYDQASPMDDGLASFLEVLNLAFVIFFFVEMVVLMMGIGPKQYFSDAYNDFDFVVVWASVIEVLLAIMSGGELEGSVASALRTLRLARLFRLVKSWETLRHIVDSLIATIPNIASCCLLLLLYMFMSSIAGMQLLGERLPEDSRSRFSNFWISMLTIFSMLSGENWNEFMYEAIKPPGEPTNWGFAVFYVLIFIIGGFVVLNLFLAILLAEFDAGPDPDYSFEGFAAMFGYGSNKTEEAEKEESTDISPALDALEAADEKKAMNEKKPSIGFGSAAPKAAKSGDRAGTPKKSAPPKMMTSVDRKASMNAADISSMGQKVMEKEKQASIAAYLKLEGKAFGCMSPSNPVRIVIARVVKTQIFDNFILLLILVTSIFLAMENANTDTTAGAWPTIKLLDMIFLGIFTGEIVVKWVTFGVAWESPSAYFRDWWNILDFAVVVLAWIPILFSGDTEAFRTLRALRALRPLRTIKRLPGLRIVVEVSLRCIPTFINICFVVFFVFLVFAIMGVQFFGGKFWSCNDATVSGASECYGMFHDPDSGEATQREWKNQKMNFDNTMVAILTLYEVSSLEMWLDVMYAAMDAGDVGSQPQFEQNGAMAIYFVAFVMFGVFLVLNLFVGAVIDKFNDLKDENDGVNPLLTDSQVAYANTVATMIRNRPYRKPVPPRLENPWMGSAVRAFRMKCYDIAMSPKFEFLITGLILGNVVVMGLVYWIDVPENEVYPFPDDSAEHIAKLQSTTYMTMIGVLNDMFTFVFLGEMIFKFAAYGFSQYVKDPVNLFDMALVCASVVGFFMELLLDPFVLNPAVFRVIRVARITRVFRAIRVIQRFKGLAKLVDTLALAMPSMLNVASLLFLVLFIFTCLGMSFFGAMDTDKDWENGMYNAHCNFAEFGSGFMLLFRSATGESWNGIMHDVMLEYPSAWVYFVVYMLVVGALLFELLTAIVLDQFDDLATPADAVPEDFMSTFMHHWANIDKTGTRFIPFDSVPALMMSLQDVDPPVFKNRADAHMALTHMDMVVDTDEEGNMKVHYVDVMMALVKYLFLKKGKARALGEGETMGDRESGVLEELDGAFDKSEVLSGNVARNFPALPNEAEDGTSDYKSHFAATKVQGIFKSRLAKKKVAKKRAQKKQKDNISTLGGYDQA